ncbi:DUF6011 domain-containing protein [Mycobacterium sp. SMC-19]|uniref:DUF6011 domain-containing protein n=1 Tax=Mycobacterium sp. SMC-19 TaxID=3381630 RepID=UPI0038773593
MSNKAQIITEGGIGLRPGVPTDLVPWRIAVQCRCCNRWLTDPQSVRAGIGPSCAVREAG